ncbi:MAG TPA: nucleotidyltransferase domain-containing protein [Stellaceae bacterium]|jgi:hypothetical protein|nr:nucleotidyltransferase domain-containing protein [Stellaceae bacterium]
MNTDQDTTPASIALRSLDDETLGELCRRYRVRRLDLFGSATGERFAPDRSDFDFLVSFEPMSPAHYATAYLGLREALERLSDRAVDLVTEAALANPYLRRNIDATKRPLFIRA